MDRIQFPEVLDMTPVSAWASSTSLFNIFWWGIMSIREMRPVIFYAHIVFLQFLAPRVADGGANSEIIAGATGLELAISAEVEKRRAYAVRLPPPLDLTSAADADAALDELRKPPSKPLAPGTPHSMPVLANARRIDAPAAALNGAVLMTPRAPPGSSSATMDARSLNAAHNFRRSNDEQEQAYAGASGALSTMARSTGKIAAVLELSKERSARNGAFDRGVGGGTFPQRAAFAKAVLHPGIAHTPQQSLGTPHGHPPLQLRSTGHPAPSSHRLQTPRQSDAGSSNHTAAPVAAATGAESRPPPVPAQVIDISDDDASVSAGGGDAIKSNGDVPEASTAFAPLVEGKGRGGLTGSGKLGVGGVGTPARGSGKSQPSLLAAVASPRPHHSIPKDDTSDEIESPEDMQKPRRLQRTGISGVLVASETGSFPSGSVAAARAAPPSGSLSRASHQSSNTGSSGGIGARIAEHAGKYGIQEEPVVNAGGSASATIGAVKRVQTANAGMNEDDALRAAIEKSVAEAAAAEKDDDKFDEADANFEVVGSAPASRHSGMSRPSHKKLRSEAKESLEHSGGRAPEHSGSRALEHSGGRVLALDTAAGVPLDIASSGGMMSDAGGGSDSDDDVIIASRRSQQKVKPAGDRESNSVRPPAPEAVDTDCVDLCGLDDTPSASQGGGGGGECGNAVDLGSDGDEDIGAPFPPAAAGPAFPLAACRVGTALLPPRQATYRLQSVIRHEGRKARAGHYTTDARPTFSVRPAPDGAVGDAWNRYDDATVFRKTLGQVMGEDGQRQAYVLVYARVEG
jgi:hypothetical protein